MPPNNKTAKAGQTKPPVGAATDAAAIQQQWGSHFAELKGPRGSQGVEHPFLSVVWAVPVAVMGDLHSIEQWTSLNTLVLVGQARHLWNTITRETMVYLTSLPCDANITQFPDDFLALTLARSQLNF